MADLTVKEIARLLGKHEQTIYRRVGKLSADEMAEYIDNRVNPYTIDSRAFPELEAILQNEYTEFEDVPTSSKEKKPVEGALVDYLKQEIRELKEKREEQAKKITELTAQRDTVNALFLELKSRMPELAEGNPEQVGNTANKGEKNASEPTNTEEQGNTPKTAEKPLNGSKWEMSDTTFYIVLASIAILGAVGLYVVEVL